MLIKCTYLPNTYLLGSQITYTDHTARITNKHKNMHQLYELIETYRPIFKIKSHIHIASFYKPYNNDPTLNTVDPTIKNIFVTFVRCYLGVDCTRMIPKIR